MKLWEALRLMQEEGKICRMVGFKTSYRWDKQRNALILIEIDQPTENLFTDMMNDWELIPEPKKTRKLVVYQWIFSGSIDEGGFSSCWMKEGQEPDSFDWPFRYRLDDTRREIEVKE